MDLGRVKSMAVDFSDFTDNISMNFIWFLEHLEPHCFNLNSKVFLAPHHICIYVFEPFSNFAMNKKTTVMSSKRFLAKSELYILVNNFEQL